jgi:hypothetical protein
MQVSHYKNLIAEVKKIKNAIGPERAKEKKNCRVDDEAKMQAEQDKSNHKKYQDF